MATVKALIERLLDCDMAAEVKILVRFGVPDAVGDMAEVSERSVDLVGVNEKLAQWPRRVELFTADVRIPRT